MCLFVFTDPPVVELRLGDTLNPANIKEGDDVYFECGIRSNPPKHRITWFHNVSTPPLSFALEAVPSSPSLPSSEFRW